MADLRGQLTDGLTGRYTLGRELGRGGMATVFLAHDLKHDRPVALKVLLPELAASLGPDRFQREIRFAARLQHPHILTVLDSGETAGQLWFTMPYVEGESLRARLNSDGQLALKEALRIAREAAQALNYAHQHQIIHRDIKPENILLTGDGSTLVADFGIARAIGGDAGEALTQTGLSVGTPAYMSPEQANGTRSVDGRSDVYSLACVLYEMLAGEPPFTGPTAAAILMRRFSEAPPSVRKLRANVPEAVDQALQQALAQVPGDRFPTAGAFAEALEAVVVTPTATPTVATAPATTSPVPATASTPQLQPSAPARRRFPTGAAMLLLGFLVGLGLLFAWQRSRAGAAMGSEGPKRVAVLPFENLGDSSSAYFADGITDEVRGKLSQIQGLAVIARASSNEYRHTGKQPQQIARELGADFCSRPRCGGEACRRDQPGAREPGAGAGGSGCGADHHLAASVRRRAHRRLPGAGGHRRQGCLGPRRGARREPEAGAHREAYDQPRRLRRIPQRRGGVPSRSGWRIPRRSELRPGSTSRRSCSIRRSRRPGRNWPGRRSTTTTSAPQRRRGRRRPGERPSAPRRSRQAGPRVSSPWATTTSK